MFGKSKFLEKDNIELRVRNDERFQLLNLVCKTITIPKKDEKGGEFIRGVTPCKG